MHETDTHTGPAEPQQMRPRMIRLALGLLLGAAVFFAVDRGTDAVLMRGLDRYFGLDTPGAVLLVGHSHVVLGISKTRLERALERPVAKYARAGAQLEDRITMVRHYAQATGSDPQLILFGVDGHLFAPRGLSSNAHRLFYPHMSDPLIDTYVKGKAQSPSEYLSRRFIHLARYNDVMLNAARRGLSSDWSSGVGGRFNADKLAQRAALGDFRRIGLDAGQIALFETFLDETDAKGWPVVLTFVPTTDAWNALEPEKFAQVIARLDSYAARYPNVQFLDMREGYDSQHALFTDPVHLNAKGQRQVTDDLAAALPDLVPALAPPKE